MSPGRVTIVVGLIRPHRRENMVNRYGRKAEAYYRTYLPNRLAEIPAAQVEEFFTELGEQVESQIEQLAEDLTGPDPVEEDYLGKVGRLRNAQMRAEEMVLAEMVFLPKEPGTEDREMPHEPVPGVTYPQ
jgi:hypothetical protein